MTPAEIDRLHASLVAIANNLGPMLAGLGVAPDRALAIADAAVASIGRDEVARILRGEAPPWAPR